MRIDPSSRRHFGSEEDTSRVLEGRMGWPRPTRRGRTMIIGCWHVGAGGHCDQCHELRQSEGHQVREGPRKRHLRRDCDALIELERGWSGREGRGTG